MRYQQARRLGSVRCAAQGYRNDRYDRGGRDQQRRMPYNDVDRDTLLSYQPGDVVDGVVVNVQRYGCFIRVTDQVQGLLHISQISHDHVDESELMDLLPVGTDVKVMVLSQRDVDKGRLAFSTKQLEPEEGDMLRDPQSVFARAEEMAAHFKERQREYEQRSSMRGQEDDEYF